MWFICHNKFGAIHMYMDLIQWSLSDIVFQDAAGWSYQHKGSRYYQVWKCCRNRWKKKPGWFDHPEHLLYNISIIFFLYVRYYLKISCCWRIQFKTFSSFWLQKFSHGVTNPGLLGESIIKECIIPNFDLVDPRWYILSSLCVLSKHNSFNWYSKISIFEKGPANKRKRHNAK